TNTPTNTPTITPGGPTLTPTITDTPTRTPTPDCGQAWRVVSSPNIGSLSDIAEISANDMWAVGGSQTLHWDGEQWNVVPNPGSGTLKGIAAVSAGDVWAVGYTGNNTFTMHWDGT